MTGANATLLRRALMACVVAFAFAFVLVPVYRIACEKVFGIKLDGAAQESVGFDVDPSRDIVVEFDTSVNSRLPWSFRAEQSTLKVHPGQITEAMFYARNDSDKVIVGQAVPSVAPSAASIYFNKTECFCFTQQTLAPGEEREMPVRFVIDPALPDKVATLTLSYTFFNNEAATERERASASLAAGAH